MHKKHPQKNAEKRNPGRDGKDPEEDPTINTRTRKSKIHQALPILRKTNQPSRPG